MITKKQQIRIEGLFQIFKKDKKDMFPFSEKGFKDIYIFFGRKPKQILFPFGKIEETDIYIGTDEN